MIGMITLDTESNDTILQFVQKINCMIKIQLSVHLFGIYVCARVCVCMSVCVCMHACMCKHGTCLELLNYMYTKHMSIIKYIFVDIHSLKPSSTTFIHS